MSVTELHPGGESSPEEALAAARRAEGIPEDGNVNGRSISDRAGDDFDADHEDGEDEDVEQEELFVLEQGRRVTISQLVSRGTEILYKMNLNSKSIKGGGNMGLLPYSNPDILFVVPARQGDVRHSPTYDESGIVQKVTIYVNFKPLTVHDAKSREGRALLGLPEEED